MSGPNPFNSNADPQDFLKQFWSGLKMPLPGMVTPTLDTDELDKRIADLKAVEGWLKMNLQMLQMSIQGLEMQKMTLNAMRTMSQSPGADGQDNPFASAAMNPALWAWNLMGAMATAEQPKAEDAPPAQKNGAEPR